MANQLIGRTWARLGLLEYVALAALASSIALALGTETPMLRRSFELELGPRLWPTRIHELTPPAAGRFAIERGVGYGCMRVRTAAGELSKPICNRHLTCHRPPRLPEWDSDFEIFPLARGDAYFVATGSQCDSSCCDVRGVVLSADGRRLDDSPLQRIEHRLDCGVWMALIGGLCLVAIVLGRRSLWTVGGVVLGFGWSAWQLYVLL